MMISTYTCSAIIFPEDESDYLNSYNQFQEFEGATWSFEDWLDFNFDFAFQDIFYGVDSTNKASFDLYLHESIWNHYRQMKILTIGSAVSEYGIFEIYGYTYPAIGGGWNINPVGAGVRWFNSKWVQEPNIIEKLLGIDKADIIRDKYHEYLQKIGAEDKPEGSLIDTIQALLGNLWDGFTQIIRLLTFTNIPNCPAWIVGIMNCFFIPMWIVLAIGIAPYVSDMIKTIASFIDSWTPW